MSPRRYPVLAARELIRGLNRAFGNVAVRQPGSHIRLQTEERGRHSVTVPNHDPLQRGTLAGIIEDVASHFDIPEEEVIHRLSGNPRRKR